MKFRLFNERRNEVNCLNQNLALHRVSVSIVHDVIVMHVHDDCQRLTKNN